MSQMIHVPYVTCDYSHSQPVTTQ